MNTFTPAFWLDALSASIFATSFEFAPGNTRTTASVTSGLHLDFGRRKPQCQRCHGPEIDLAQLATYAERGECACAGCGASIPLRRADDFCIAINSGARYVVNEQAPDAAGRALQARTKPIVFQCMSCGGSLQVDGSSRLVTCKFCNGDNYLPDGLWQLLNPVPKPEPFFFVCEYENEAERAERASRETPEALATLALDASPLVRRAVGANPRTPPAVLEKLAFDKDRSVLEGLASNPSLPSAIVDEMAQSKDPEFRALAARHPNLSPGHLPRLARQGPPDVKHAAANRMASLQAQGVRIDEEADAPPLKGFFARLFGD